MLHPPDQCDLYGSQSIGKMSSQATQSSASSVQRPVSSALYGFLPSRSRAQQEDSSGVPNPSSQRSQPPPLAPDDKYTTSIRLILMHTQASFEDFSKKQDSVTKSISDTVKELVVLKQSLDEREDRLHHHVSDTGSRLQAANTKSTQALQADLMKELQMQRVAQEAEHAKQLSHQESHLLRHLSDISKELQLQRVMQADTLKELRTHEKTSALINERLNSLQAQIAQLHQAPVQSNASVNELLESRLADRFLQFQQVLQPQLSQLHHNQSMQVKVLEGVSREIPYESMVLIKEIVRSEVAESLTHFQPLPQFSPPRSHSTYDDRAPNLHTLKQDILEEQAASFRDISLELSKMKDLFQQSLSTFSRSMVHSEISLQPSSPDPLLILPQKRSSMQRNLSMDSRSKRRKISAPSELSSGVHSPPRDRPKLDQPNRTQSSFEGSVHHQDTPSVPLTRQHQAAASKASRHIVSLERRFLPVQHEETRSSITPISVVGTTAPSLLSSPRTTSVSTGSGVNSRVQMAQNLARQSSSSPHDQASANSKLFRNIQNSSPLPSSTAFKNGLDTLPPSSSPSEIDRPSGSLYAPSEVTRGASPFNMCLRLDPGRLPPEEAVPAYVHTREQGLCSSDFMTTDYASDTHSVATTRSNYAPGAMPRHALAGPGVAPPMPQGKRKSVDKPLSGAKRPNRTIQLPSESQDASDNE